MELNLKGKTALVTGGSQGIGRACAEALAGEQVKVAIVARNHNILSETAESISRKTGKKIVTVSADISTAAGVESAILGTAQELGKIDILINNAGSAPMGRVSELTDAVWQEAFDLKVMGYVRCARAIMDDMRKQGWGRIINIIGRGGHFPSANYISGGAMNAALLNVTQALAEECGKDNVLVNAVNPTATDTGRWHSLVQQQAKITGNSGAEINSRAKKAVPLGRIGKPEDIANMVVFLCSDKAGFINGALVDIDGGQSRAL
ncbi:MAG: short-chain dehydrogenase [Rhodospirillaceae bacterium]|nr:short-chain dehydrogenase [Rhodospirillaceae bacterium]